MRRSWQKSGKYALTIWPYHAMLGGIGHALVSVGGRGDLFPFGGAAAQTDIVIKGETHLHGKLFGHWS